MLTICTLDKVQFFVCVFYILPDVTQGLQDKEPSKVREMLLSGEWDPVSFFGFSLYLLLGVLSNL